MIPPSFVDLFNASPMSSLFSPLLFRLRLLWLEDIPFLISSCLDNPPCRAVFLYFLVLVSIATVREFSRESKTRSPGDESKLKPPDKLNNDLSVFDLAKTAYLPGHADRVIAELKGLDFPLDWRTPTAAMTLLQCAILGGDVGLINHLIKAGSDILAQNAFGDSCMYLAVWTFTSRGFSGHKTVDREKHDSDQFYILKMLLENGADVNLPNREGHTPLHLASSSGRADVVDFLLKHGAISSVKNYQGRMPLQIALDHGFLETATLLQRDMSRALRQEKKLNVKAREDFFERIMGHNSQVGVPNDPVVAKQTKASSSKPLGRIIYENKGQQNNGTLKNSHLNHDSALARLLTHKNSLNAWNTDDTVQNKAFDCIPRIKPTMPWRHRQ